jgi:hypothetical protein
VDGRVFAARAVPVGSFSTERAEAPAIVLGNIVVNIGEGSGILYSELVQLVERCLENLAARFEFLMIVLPGRLQPQGANQRGQRQDLADQRCQDHAIRQKDDQVAIRKGTVIGDDVRQRSRLILFGALFALLVIVLRLIWAFPAAYLGWWIRTPWTRRSRGFRRGLAGNCTPIGTNTTPFRMNVSACQTAVAWIRTPGERK